MAAPLTLDALHCRARQLERAHRSGDEAAIARVAPYRPHARKPLKDAGAPRRKPLKDAGAQLVIARELGFPTWARLRAYVERVGLGGAGLEHAFHTDLEDYEGRADGL